MVFSSYLYPKHRYNMQIQNVMPGFNEEIVLTTYKFIRGRKQFSVNIYFIEFFIRFRVEEATKKTNGHSLHQ